MKRDRHTEIVERRMRKALQPKRRIHSRKPVIKRNQLRILPPRLNQMHQPTQLFKTKQKVEVWIPMPPKMPEPLRRGGTGIPVCPAVLLEIKKCVLRNPSLHPAQSQNHPSRHCLQPDQPNRMRQILRK